MRSGGARLPQCGRRSARRWVFFFRDAADAPSAMEANAPPCRWQLCFAKTMPCCHKSEQPAVGCTSAGSFATALSMPPSLQSPKQILAASCRQLPSSQP